jgi:hypothetical protein
MGSEISGNSYKYLTNEMFFKIRFGVKALIFFVFLSQELNEITKSFCFNRNLLLKNSAFARYFYELHSYVLNVKQC